jgi:hypothetical protein
MTKRYVARAPGISAHQRHTPLDMGPMATGALKPATTTADATSAHDASAGGTRHRRTQLRTANAMIAKPARLQIADSSA